MPKTPWEGAWSVGVRVGILRGKAPILGEGRAELLAAIGRHRSITKAAKAVGMSYRQAWTLVQLVNEAAGEPLVEAAVGGIKGGGAELTARGRTALEVYEKVRRTLVAAAGAALQQAVNPSIETTPCVHLAAAISLQEVLGELLAEYALRQPTVRVRAVFGASNELAEHVLAGAPCDIFISAESAEIDRLDAARLLALHSRRTVAANGLAAIALPGRKGIRRVADLLASDVKHVALAELACPLGRYSHDYLQAAGVYETLLPKVLHVNNSRAVPSAVLSGAADVGLAFASDAVQFDECQTLFRVPTSKVAAEYIAAIIKRGQQQTEAVALLDFLDSKAAGRCFRRLGFRRTK